MAIIDCVYWYIDQINSQYIQLVTTKHWYIAGHSSTVKSMDVTVLQRMVCFVPTSLIICGYGFNKYCLFFVAQISILFTFLARQMGRRNNGISIDNNLFEQVLVGLCAPHCQQRVDGNHEERQQALIQLLSTSALEHFNESRLLNLAYSAKFYRVVELVCKRQRKFDQVLSCYCHDSSRTQLAFDFVQRTMTDKTVSAEEKYRLRQSALDNLAKLVKVDASRATKMVMVTLGIPVRDAFKHLDDSVDDECVCQFLGRVFEYYSDMLNCAEDIADLDVQIYERYVELLCKLATPSDVVCFLNSTNGYRPEVAMDICGRLCVTEAVVCLMEKTGRARDAFELALLSLRSKISDCVLCDDEETVTSDLDRHLDNTVGLLCRHSADMDQSVREQMWYALVDSLVGTFDQIRTRLLSTTPKQNGGTCRDETSHSDRQLFDKVEHFKKMIQNVVTAMIQHVSFDKLVNHVLTVTGNDVNSCASCFGNVRDLLVGMIDSCRYERETVEACSRIVRRDVLESIVLLSATTSGGVVPKCDACVACSRPLVSVTSDTFRRGPTDRDNDVICFRCGHAFHRLCLVQSSSSEGHSLRRRSGRAVQSEISADTTTMWRCLTCSNSRTGWKTRVMLSARQLAGVSDSADSGSLDACDRSCFSRTLDEVRLAQLTAVREMRQAQRTASNMAVLTQLKQLLLLEESQNVSKVKSLTTANKRSGSDLLHDERFLLKLSPPPPPV